ncbi:hypothetical protein BH11MYX1_BH11MYX1_10470 [soil metagenome]
MFVGIPLAVAFALRNTRVWWFAGAATIAVAVFAVTITFFPYAAPDTAVPWLVICALYAAFGTLLIRRPVNSREPG